MAWNRGGTGAGDESVEAAGLGGGLQKGTGNRGMLGAGFICWHAWTARQLGTHGLAVRWCMQMPRFEDVSKVGNCVHLGDTCGRNHPCKGSSDNLKAMDDSILC